MLFKDVKPGQIFTNSALCDYFIKIDDTLSVVWDFENECVFRDHSGEIEYTFSQDLEVTIEED